MVFKWEAGHCVPQSCKLISSAKYEQPLNISENGVSQFLSAHLRKSTAPNLPTFLSTHKPFWPHPCSKTHQKSTPKSFLKLPVLSSKYFLILHLLVWERKGYWGDVFKWMFSKWKGQRPLAWLPASALLSAGTQVRGRAAQPDMEWSIEGSPANM